MHKDVEPLDQLVSECAIAGIQMNYGTEFREGLCKILVYILRKLREKEDG